MATDLERVHRWVWFGKLKEGVTVEGVEGSSGRTRLPNTDPPLSLRAYHSPISPSMDTSGYDVKAWQAYYESQGYDAATASSYAYYALQQAQAASTSTAAASSSSAAYGVRSSQSAQFSRLRADLNRVFPPASILLLHPTPRRAADGTPKWLSSSWRTEEEQSVYLAPDCRASRTPQKGARSRGSGRRSSEREEERCGTSEARWSPILTTLPSC